MEELIKRLERVIQTGVPDKNGMHPISAEAVLEVVKELSELGTNLAEVGTDCSEFPNNSDAISRQAAIDALSTITMYKGSIPIDTAVMRIEKLPPIQSKLLQPWEVLVAQSVLSQPAEPKRGKWILDRSGAYCCSKCMEPCAGYVMMKPRDKFCKMCGSRNEVTE